MTAMEEVLDVILRVFELILLAKASSASVARETSAVILKEFDVTRVSRSAIAFVFVVILLELAFKLFVNIGQLQAIGYWIRI